MPTPLNQKFADWLDIQTFSDPALEKIVIACDEWLAAFQSGCKPHWLSLIGISGTGKTKAAMRLWNYCRNHVRSDWSKTLYCPRVILWPDFVQQLRAGDAFDLRSDLKKWPVLFLDDIGANRDTTGFATEELSTLLSCRVGKWTLLTSNLSADGLQNLDQRIYSRLFRDGSICVGVNTVDFNSR